MVDFDCLNGLPWDPVINDNFLEVSVLEELDHEAA
jgi:hypothetical protein